MIQASQATAVADIAVVGSALGAYPGAEVVGVVRSLPAAAEADSAPATSLQPGQVVVVPRLLPCGDCDRCRRGRVAVCAQRLVRPGRPQPIERLPVRFLLPLAPPFRSEPPPAEDLFRYAALSDALLAPYSALVRAGIGPGALCVIVGRGSRAALSVVVARALGAAAVVASPGLALPDRQRLQAPPFDALSVLWDEAQDPAASRAQLRQIAIDAGLAPHGFCILETSGSDAGRIHALSLLSDGGTALLLDRAQPLARANHTDQATSTDPLSSIATPIATPGLAMDVPVGPLLGGAALLDRAVAEGCTVLGGGSVHPDLLVELLALCDRARIDLRQLTRRIEPHEVDSVMAARRAGQGDLLTLPIVDYGQAASQAVTDPSTPTGPA